MKTISFLLLFGLLALSACTKTYRVAKETSPKLIQKEFAASPNDVYYALRWAFRSHGYPMAIEDLQNGVLKTRYVPVTPSSHYVAVFDRKDYGVTGAYHQLEARLVPRGGKTLLKIGSKIQGVVANIHSNGSEEKMILGKVADYLRDPNVQVTNQGVQE